MCCFVVVVSFVVCFVVGGGGGGGVLFCLFFGVCYFQCKSICAIAFLPIPVPPDPLSKLSRWGGNGDGTSLAITEPMNSLCRADKARSGTASGRR